MTILIHREKNKNHRSGRPRISISKMIGPGVVGDKIRRPDLTPEQIVEFINKPLPINPKNKQENLPEYLL